MVMIFDDLGDRVGLALEVFSALPLERLALGGRAVQRVAGLLATRATWLDTDVRAHWRVPD